MRLSPRLSRYIRRTATGRLDEEGVAHARHRLGDALDEDGMLPAVAEVIEVFQRPGADILQHVFQSPLARVERSVAEVGIWNAPADVASADLIPAV